MYDIKNPDSLAAALSATHRNFKDRRGQFAGDLLTFSLLKGAVVKQIKSPDFVIGAYAEDIKGVEPFWGTRFISSADIATFMDCNRKYKRAKLEMEKPITTPNSLLLPVEMYSLSKSRANGEQISLSALRWNGPQMSSVTFRLQVNRSIYLSLGGVNLDLDQQQELLKFYGIE